jgi:hypothetical protein
MNVERVLTLKPMRRRFRNVLDNVDIAALEYGGVSGVEPLAG